MCHFNDDPLPSERRETAAESIPQHRIRELERENAVLADIARRLRALRNDLGRIDLTDSSKRDEVYSLVRTAEGIGPT